MRDWRKWICIGLLSAIVLPVTAQVDLDPYLKQDLYEDIKISPGGDYYAVVVPLEDRSVLAVIRRSDKKLLTKVGGEKHSVVADIDWVNAQRIVVAMAEKYGSRDQPYATGELYAINADGSQRRLLFGRYGRDGEKAEPRAAFLIDTLPGDEDEILVSVRDFTANPLTWVERLNVYTGRSRHEASAPLRGARFAADASGAVRFAQGADDRNYSRLYYRDGKGAEWRLLSDAAKNGVTEWPLGFSEDGKSAYLEVQRKHGPNVVERLDIASGRRSEVLRDAAVDPHATIYRANSRVPEGVFLMHERMRTRFFDDRSPTAITYRKLEAAFAGQALAVTSSTQDGRLLVVRTWSDRSPGDFYLFDTHTNRADLIFSRRAWFDAARTATTREIELKARDGLQLHGFLTVAANAEARNLPMVVLPHGGPYGIFDEWDFHDDAQLLAQAGYVVLQLNYRGSGNYGLAHQQAGAREWGGTMQDDLTDATRWAIEQKIADPQRICIYGASYGGYAALMGVTKEPGLYRCAVGYVGVYDLVRMHKEDSRTSRPMSVWAEDWLGSRDGLAAVSPTNLASRIKVPVFLAAGGKDDRAPIAHSRKMEKALKASGVPVETLYYDTEGHGFYTEPHRREFYTKLLDFLARHIGGQRAKDG